MKIDFLTKKDKPIILKIWKSQKGIFGIPFNAEIDNLILNKQFLCMKDENMIVAICAYKIMKKNPEIRIAHLWVAPKYRRKKIASKLIGKIVELNNSELKLTACCKDGAENNNFYERYKLLDYTLEERKTINVRKYILDKSKFNKRIEND